MKESYQLNRKGCLAVHLMPKYHGRKLANAVERIARGDVRGKFELSAMLLANDEPCDDPKFENKGAKCGRD